MVGKVLGGLGLGKSSQSSNQQTNQNTTSNESVQQNQGQNVTEGSTGFTQGSQQETNWQNILNSMFGGSNQNQTGTTTGSTTGSQNQTGTTTQNPWAEQAPFLQDLWQRASEAGGWREGSQAGATMQQGWDSLLGFANGGVQGLFDNAQGVQNFMTNQDNLMPESNPFMQANLDAVTRQVQESLGQGLNQINQSSVGAGQFGGSRQGIAQGQAIQGANNTIADTSAQMLMQNYNQAQDRMLQGAQLSPMLAELGFMPGQVQSAVGQDQAQWENPWDDLNQFGNIVQGGNWGGTTEVDQTTQSSEQQQQIQDLVNQVRNWEQNQGQQTGGSQQQNQQVTQELMQRIMDAWIERDTQSNSQSSGNQSQQQTNRASPLDMFSMFMGAF